MRHFVVLCISLAVLVGCSTFAGHRYSISADNVTALRNLKGHKINVGPFSSSKPNLRVIVCRAFGPIKTPDGETFEYYIRKALIDELKMASVYSPNSRVTLTGHLNNIDLTSFGSGGWDISLTIKSSNGKIVTVEEHYVFTTSFIGETACDQTAQALMPAVQNLLGKLVHSPLFLTLLD